MRDLRTHAARTHANAQTKGADIMAKRANGSGSIYRLPNGTWRAQVTVEGRRVSHVEKTQKAATEWARKMTGQVRHGLSYEGTRKALGEFFDEWLAVKANKLRPATMEQDCRISRLHIKPRIGALALHDVNAARIQTLYSALQSDSVGKRTIEVAHTILHGCLSHARRLGLVTQNWAALAEVPRPEKREMRGWDEGRS